MKKILLGAILFQIFILLSLLLYAYLPLYFGKEIQVRAKGYDPRDLFLGNYVALDYDIAQIDSQIDYKKNETVYILLKKVDSLYVASDISYTKPNHELFLEGRVHSSHKHSDKHAYQIFLKFGIERYFSTKKHANTLEKKLEKGSAIVTLGVLFGIPRIKNIKID